MKILVNTRFLLHNKLEGIGRFTYETLKRVVLSHPEHTFYFLFDRKWHNDFVFSNNVIPLKIGPQARHPFLWYLWFHFSVPSVIRKLKPDLFVSTDGFTSPNIRCKKITVFHDIAFEHYPKDIGKLVLNFYKKYTPIFAKNSDRIVTVSEFSKRDLIEHYNLSSEIIDVVYNGSSKYFNPISESKQRDFKKQWTKNCDFFCFIGALQPRKNITRLFQAFDLFKQKTNANTKLLIVGRKAWKSDEIFNTYKQMQYKKDVVFTGHLKHDEINEVYASALGLVYIPYFEGFGIPIVEAQNSGCPVITSNVTSMPEVANDSALLTDPFNVDEIANNMERLLIDSELRESLIQLGFENCKRFSWDITAELFWNSIEKTL